MAASHQLLSMNVTPFKLCQISSNLSQNQGKLQKLTENILFDGSDFWLDSHLETDEKLP